MSWTYIQRTGELLEPDGKVAAIGYSGLGADKNLPAAEDLPDHGPLPCGTYAIEPPENTASHGPYVLALTPDPSNEMFGRSGFLIHGDSIGHPGAASHGCIIVPRYIRESIWQSGDHRLLVMSGYDNAEAVQDATIGEN